MLLLIVTDSDFYAFYLVFDVCTLGAAAAARAGGSVKAVDDAQATDSEIKVRGLEQSKGFGWPAIIIAVVAGIAIGSCARKQ